MATDLRKSAFLANKIGSLDMRCPNHSTGALCQTRFCSMIDFIRLQEIKQAIANMKLQCPNCKAKDWAGAIVVLMMSSDSRSLSDPRQFNLLFSTAFGSVQQAYLRPETAQGDAPDKLLPFNFYHSGIFVNFPSIVRSTRRRLPFGQT